MPKVEESKLPQQDPEFNASFLSHDFTTASEIITPSSEWAWFLGIIASGGSVYNEGHGSFQFHGYDSNLLNAVKITGERLLHTNAIERTDRLTANGIPYKRIHLPSNLATTIGDMRRSTWPSTIEENYHWVLEHSEHLWSFLQGFFETRGSVASKESGDDRNRIQFNTNYRNVADFLGIQFYRLGLVNPHLRKDNSTREGIKGIEITNLHDITLIARNIASVLPDKEERLEYFRSLPEQPTPTRIFVSEILLDIWRDAKNQCGGEIPTSTQFTELYRLGKTPFSFMVLVDRLGQGNWLAMVERAEELCAMQDRGEPLPKDLQTTNRAETRRELRRNVLNEWTALYAELGYTPRWSELLERFKQGTFPHHPSAIINRFGIHSGGRSYERAVEYMLAHPPKASVEKNTNTK